MKSPLPWMFLAVLLCGGTLYLGYQLGNTKASDTSALPVPVTQTQDAAPRPQLDSQNTIQPFQWSQLESTNYYIYIANLRGVGCPEQTIRDIITADVDSVYASRRDKLTENMASASIKNTLAVLRQEEDQFLLELLGPKSDRATEVASTSQPARLLRAKSQFSIPAFPLVLQTVDLTSLKLNSSQMEVIDNLRQKFRQEIGSTSDPKDPAYRERWLKAQHENDSLLRGMLGTDAYMNYLGLAANQSKEQAQ